MQQSKLPLFEKDTDQNGAPDGTTAYILRWWGTIYSGVVSRVRVADGLPALTYVAHESVVDASARPAAFPAEVSRVFVKDDAEIDPAVFTLPAPPMPENGI